MSTVLVDGLGCEVTYTIIAGGTLNGDLVGPRSSHGTITAGPCPVIITPILTPSDGMYICNLCTSSIICYPMLRYFIQTKTHNQIFYVLLTTVIIVLYE